MDSPPPKRACLHTLGCRLNQAETTLLEEKLVAAGYRIVPFSEPADLAIVNTCTVTGEADAKSRKLIRQFIRKNPGAYVAVTGCYAQTGHAALAEIEGLDLIVGNEEKLNVLDYVAEGKNATPVIVRDKMTRGDFEIGFCEGGAAIARRANLKVQDGCDFMCSFCLIPFARGRARSRALGNLLDEARSLVERGAREIVLTGVNIGAYDFEGKSVVDIVDGLNALDHRVRVRISSIEPTTIPEALFERMADRGHGLAPYLHIPLQSGSNTILRAMKRRYTREEYLDFVNRAADRVPGVGIGADVLVGFPGETERDFQDTLRIISEGPLFYAHVFKYSERDGTASCRLPGKVDPKVANVRSARLRRCSARRTRRFQESLLGRTEPVLFEQKEGGLWTGYTGNYVRVAVRSKDSLRNVTRDVRLDSIVGDVVVGEIQASAGLETKGHHCAGA